MELNREADDEHLKTLEKAVKNKFRWRWLETTVEITLKGERKATSLIEWIRKIDVPGKAKCIVCDKIISYGARGRISLTEHCKSNEHAEWFICFNFVQCKINCSCKLNFLQFNFPKK